jgi:hypothetical protein
MSREKKKQRKMNEINLVFHRKERKKKIFYVVEFYAAILARRHTKCRRIRGK